ncbi:MAG TPA: hypothetical protein VD706_03625, partial [Candidatus Saccharimonadales bacterium]|nr:hypothetical protein [Candidatus Saccharimonadales bacterium]
MTAAPTVKNCVEIVKPFRDDLERAGLLDEVQFIGGIGSAALADEATVIRPEEGIVVAPEGLHLPSRRDDGNKRDMDVLVLSTDRGRIDEVEGMAEEAVGDQLEISVFGLKDGTHVEKQLRHPVFGWKALKTFTGDRYVSEFAGETFMEKVLFPFAVPIPAESMDSGRLEVDGVWLPIATPPGALMNYVTRSVSGIRAKDADKLERMASNVFGQVPDYVDWV